MKNLDGRRLRQFLSRPAEEMPIAALPQRWRHSVLWAIAERPARFRDGFELPALVRGAWGRELARRAGRAADAVPENPTNRKPPSAFEVFFGKVGLHHRQHEIPAPYTVKVEVARALVTVEVTLFGIAEAWAQEGSEALLLALDRGIGTKGGVPTRLTPVKYGFERFGHVEVPRGLEEVVLQFETPLKRDRGRSDQATSTEIGADPIGLASLWGSFVARIGGLARWQGILAGVDARECAELAACWSALSFDAGGLVAGPRASYGSSRQHGRRIDLSGYVGHLVLAGDLGPVMPLIAIGATCHVGLHATNGGLGRYVLLGPAEATAPQ